MTTINKFYQQKRAIEIEVAEMITMHMQPFTSSEDLDKSLRMYQHGITTLLKNLQPPRPTCSTCKYYSASDSSCDNWDVVGDPSHDGFGCIEHSDYGDAK